MSLSFLKLRYHEAPTLAAEGMNTDSFIQHFEDNSTSGKQIKSNIDTPMIPTEICETIIDCISDILDDNKRADLAVLARVCRGWVPRAQMHLFRCISTSRVEKHMFDGIEGAVRCKMFLLGYTRSVLIRGTESERVSGQANIKTTNFLVTRHMPHLEHCTIYDLELERSHPLLSRFPTGAKSLSLLHLTGCKTCDVNQLSRFVTSFQSLSTLILTFRNVWTPKLPLHHLPLCRSKSSLRILVVKVQRGVSMLLDCFIRVQPFATNLKHLIVSSPHHDIGFITREISGLLNHCSQSLEELTVICGKFTVLASDCRPTLGIQAIGFSQLVSKDDAMKNPSADVAPLDNILSGELFPSLRTLRVVAIPSAPISFPKLNARKVRVEILKDHQIDVSL